MDPGPGEGENQDQVPQVQQGEQIQHRRSSAETNTGSLDRLDSVLRR